MPKKDLAMPAVGKPSDHATSKHEAGKHETESHAAEEPATWEPLGAEEEHPRTAVEIQEAAGQGAEVEEVVAEEAETEEGGTEGGETEEAEAEEADEGAWQKGEKKGTGAQTDVRNQEIEARMKRQSQLQEQEEGL
ncbi:unnamed protein product [Closterium sp. NIES-64]|nr:unnamed protein product [Closterium sp. NIES-64]